MIIEALGAAMLAGAICAVSPENWPLWGKIIAGLSCSVGVQLMTWGHDAS